ncbi:MAG: hypothetical protein P1V97_02940, partial [Planctomycetota bacterium]|nr:hypothetical protein [Planctomycetota bacterium]
ALSELYHQALRAWEASPEDIEAYTVLVGMSRRFSLPLPSAINPSIQFESFIEMLNKTYELMDSGGYAHIASGGFFELRPPYDDLESVCEAISKLADTDHESITLPYPCVKVFKVTPITELFFPHVGYYDEDKLPEKLVQPFKDLGKETKAIPLRFPNAQFFEIEAKYPDDGEVYWNITNIIYLPSFEQSFVLCIQHYW